MKDIVSIQEIREMIKGITNIRDKGLITVLYWSGRRINEVLSLQRSDVKYVNSLEGSYLLVAFKLSKTKGVDKFIKTPFPFDDTIAMEFIHFIHWFDKQRFEGNLFTIGYQRAYQIVKEIDPDISPHWFRHVRSSHLGSVLTGPELKRYIGWSDWDMVDRYTHLLPDVILRKMKQVK